MERKILFTDLDDTLLGKDKTICEENREAIARLLDQGHYIVIATGRPITTGRIVTKELGLSMPGCYMVAFNGAVIYDCAAERVLAQRALPLRVTKEIIDEAHKAGIYVQSYQQDIILTEQHGPELDFYLSHAKMRYQLVSDIYGSLEAEPNKVILIDVNDQERLLNFQKEHTELSEKCNSFFSRNEFLEYCPKDTDKGTGLKYIAQFLNVPLEHTVAVGDERNDIPMLRAAHIGVAVKNAHISLKRAADYVTEQDCGQGAIAEVIEKFILKDSMREKTLDTDVK